MSYYPGIHLEDNHLYYEGPPAGEFLFSSSELAQIHRNLGHAPAGAVYSALRRTYSIETDTSDLTKLQQINEQCKGCQLYSKQPNRYRAVLPYQCVFNFDVALDVMFIYQRPILHAVCRQTHFYRAVVLKKQDSYTIWYTFMRNWVAPYLGVPHNLWVNHAKAFLSTQFNSLANSLGCNLIPVAVEAHWSLIAERYHDPLHRITQKLILDHPSAPLDLVLDYANLAMSHTVGPEGFTPAILAFESQPRLPIGNYIQQPQTVVNRMDLMSSARREYEAIVSGLRVLRALHAAKPNEATQELTPWDEVLVYRENKGWQVPYTFLYRDGRLSVVLDNTGVEHLFHNTMLKPYTRPYISVRDIINPTYDSDISTDNSLYSYLVQMIQDEFDPRFKDACLKEYNGNKNKGGVVPFLRSNLTPNPNIVRNRYVLCIKDPGTITERYKAICILMGHTDKLRREISKNSPILMRMSFSTIISFAVLFFSLLIWTRNVEQAYMQAKALMRDVFTEAPPEAELPDTNLLKFILSQ